MWITLRKHRFSSKLTLFLINGGPILLLKVAIFFKFLYKIYHQNRCNIMGHLYYLTPLYQFYKRIFWEFIMDCTNFFGCGVFIFGCFSKVFDILVLFLTVILGFKVVQFGNIALSGTTTRVFGNGGDQKMVGYDELVNINGGFRKESDDCCRGSERHEICDDIIDADQVFDVMSLRKMVKIEKKRVSLAREELEKERMAAGSAADEAMAMILKLQNEKSLLQMQVKQLHRLVEDKKEYDEGVIKNLKWIVVKHESERCLLEEQLRVCSEKLKQYVKDDEWDKFDHVCTTPSVSYAS